jgi:hypothetical protein
MQIIPRRRYWLADNMEEIVDDQPGEIKKL